MSKKVDNQSFNIPIITTQLELETKLYSYPAENTFILTDENTTALLPDLIKIISKLQNAFICLLYTSPSPRDRTRSRMPSSA